MAEIKKFLDQTGTSYLWQKINTQLNLKAAQADLEALEDRVDTIEANGYDDTAVRALISANTTAIGTKADQNDLNLVSDKLDTLVDTDTNKSARTIAAEEVAKIVANADSSFDTLKEIADWISTHTSDAAAMNSAITALQTLTAGLGENTTVKQYVDSAITALNIGDYATAADLTAAVARITALEADSHTHANKTVLDGITAAKVTAWDAAEANAKAYADGLATNYDAAGAADAVYAAILAMSSSDIDTTIANASN